MACMKLTEFEAAHSIEVTLVDSINKQLSACLIGLKQSSCQCSQRAGVWYSLIMW